jgi:hypothetical protein
LEWPAHNKKLILGAKNARTLLRMSSDATPPPFTLDAGFAFAANLLALIVQMFGAPESWLKQIPLRLWFVVDLKKMLHPLEDLVRLLLIARAHGCELSATRASIARHRERKSVVEDEDDRVFVAFAYNTMAPLLPSIKQEQRARRVARESTPHTARMIMARESEIAFLARRLVMIERILQAPEIYAQALARRVQNWGPLIAEQLQETFPPSCAQAMLNDARAFVKKLIGAAVRLQIGPDMDEVRRAQMGLCCCPLKIGQAHLLV